MKEVVEDWRLISATVENKLMELQHFGECKTISKIAHLYIVNWLHHVNVKHQVTYSHKDYQYTIVLI